MEMETKKITNSTDYINGARRSERRKLKGNWSMKIQEDMQCLYDIDVEKEMINILSEQIQAEIDKELLDDMVTTAKGNSKFKGAMRI